MTDTMGDQSIITPVAVDGGVLYIEATSLPGVPEAQDSAWSEDEEVADVVPDLSSVTAALSGFASQVTQALRQARPDKVTLEFGCELALESSGLSVLIAKGSAKSNLKVTMEWQA
ncbi:CU044_2847 family protein [Streptomyces sp. NPDC002676]